MRKALISIGVILIILLAVLAAFLLSPPGLRFTLDFGKKYLPGTLTYKKVTGIILRPITLYDVTYKEKNFKVHVQKLRINWHLFALFKKKVVITSLNIDKLSIYTQTDKTDPLTIDDVRQLLDKLTHEPTIKVVIKQMHIDQLAYYVDGEKTFALDDLTFHYAGDPQSWQAHFNTFLPSTYPMHRASMYLNSTPEKFFGEINLRGSNTNWQLIANGNAHQIKIITTKNKLLNGEADLTLQLARKNLETLQGELHFNKINLAVFDKALPKTISGKITLDKKNEAIHIQSDLQTPDGDINLSFHQEKDWHLNWKLNVHNIASFDDNFSGRLESTGFMKTVSHRLESEGTLHVSQLALDNIRTRKLAMRWAFNVNGDKKVSLTADATHLFINGTHIQSVDAALNGTEANHHLKADIAFKNHTATLALRGTYKNNQWSAILNQLDIYHNNIKWSLRNSAQIFYANNLLRASGLCLENHMNGHFCINGTWQRDGNLNLAVDGLIPATTLNPFLPNKTGKINAGTINAQLHITGPLAKPNISGTGSVENGEIYLAGPDITVSNLSVRGASKNNQWNATLNQVDIYHDNIKWSLRNSAQIFYANNLLRARGLCIENSSNGHFCINGSWQLDGNLDLAVDGLIPATTLNPFLPNEMGKINAGTVNAQLRITGPLAKPNISGTGSVENGAIHLAGPDITVSNLSVHGAYKNNQWSATLNQVDIRHQKIKWSLKNSAQIFYANNLLRASGLCLENHMNGHFCINGSWQLDENLDLAVDGLIPATTLNPFIPNEMAKINAGTINTKLHITGPFAKPNISGTGSVANGEIYLPALNITLSNIDGQFHSINDQLHLNLTAFSNNQPITLETTTDLRDPGYPSTIHLTTDRLRVINTAEYVVYATSDLKGVYKDNLLSVTGTVHIPEAQIKPANFDSTVTLPTQDIVYAHEKPGNGLPLQTKFDIHLTLGDKVFIKAKGLEAHLDGGVMITSDPTQGTFATGNIFVRDGTYSIFGSELTIGGESFLSYTHSELTNPSLHINAFKTVKTLDSLGATDLIGDSNLIVGVNVTGSIDRPKLNFYSTPSTLSQTDILSYILLGRPASGAGGAGAADVLLSALSALTPGSDGDKKSILSSLQSGLGLSSFGIQSDSSVDAMGNPLQRQSSFVIGKNLSRRFYIQYSIGIFHAGNIIQLRYLLSKCWAIQINSNTTNSGAGMDILYTVNKN